MIPLTLFGHLFYLHSMKPEETYPVDSYLAHENEKKALIIVAHDDDAISCAGTVSRLVKEGWTIDYITFYGRWHGEINSIRKEELAKACNIQGIKSVKAIDFPLQRTDTVKMPWMPIPYSKFNDYFQMDSIAQIVKSAIIKSKPTVIFSSDNVIGGYGHPEHIAVSQAVLTSCRELKKEGNLTVKKIYQSVFTPTQAENTIGDMAPFISGKKVYQCDGMPLPSIQIDISSSIAQKKSVMNAYVTQKGPIKKVWPYFNWYPGWIYFNIFKYEYFHVVEDSSL
jgi:LmbE family N-acetylglucosaminyl deacetylase